MKEGRGTGKTTNIMVSAINALAEIPDGAHVYITGAHPNWLKELSHRFKAAGLDGVRFLTPHQICNGALHGGRGVLLFDDFHDIPHWQQSILMEEQQRMRRMLMR